jgi:hypothetical protein
MVKEVRNASLESGSHTERKKKTEKKGRKPLCRLGKREWEWSQFQRYRKEWSSIFILSSMLRHTYLRKKVVSCFVRPSSCQSQDLPDTLENPKYDSVFYSTIRSFGVTSVVVFGHSVL